MARLNKLQTNFTGGEVSPRAYGRVDLAKYQTGLKELVNFIGIPTGGVRKREGTEFIASAETNTARGSRLLKFIYSNTQSYVLEFSNGKICFFKDRGQILQGRGITNGTFTTDLTGWVDRDAGTGASTQSAGTMLLTGGGAGNEARRYQSIANLGINQYTVTCDIATATTTYRVGTSAGGSSIASGTLTVGTGKTFDFTPTVNGTVYIEFECAATSSVDNVVLSSPEYAIDSPYNATEIWEIKYRQFFDTLYIVHPDHPPYQIQRLGHDNWSISQVTFDEPAYLDINSTTVTMTPSAVTGAITMTASSATFASTDVGRAIRYKSGPDKTDVTYYTGTGSQTYFDIPFYPQGSSDLTVDFVEATGALTSKTYTAGAPGAGQFTITNGQVRTGDTASTSQRVRIAPSNAGSGEWGWMTITGYTSATQVSCDVEVDLGGTNASTEWRLGAWSDTTGWPSAIEIHEQRLYLASTTTQPEYFWGSEIATFTNFQPDTVLRTGEVDSSTSLSFAISGNGGKKILWMASKGSLLMGTQNGVHKARGSNGAISAINITVSQETSTPCLDLDAIITESEVLFLQRLGKKLRSTYFSFDIDGYQTDDLNLVAEHIGLDSPMSDICFQDDQRVAWILKENGSLVSTTYFRSQQVNTWAKHVIGGTDVSVESIVSIPTSTSDEVWLLVSRTINGSTKRYLEILGSEFIGQDITDAKFMDSYLVYEGADTATITGLDHLEGQTVTILSQGSPVASKVVSSGQIILDNSTTKCIIGLGYNAYLTTLDIEGGSVIGTAQGQLSRVHEISLRLYETVGLRVGSEEANCDELIFRSPSDNMNEAVPMFSGFKTIKFPKGYDNSYFVHIRSENPLPCTILSLIFNVWVADS